MKKWGTTWDQAQILGHGPWPRRNAKFENYYQDILTHTGPIALPGPLVIGKKLPNLTVL